MQRLTDDLGLESKLSLDDIALLSFKEDVLFRPGEVLANNVPSISAAKKQKKAADLEARATYRAFLPQFNLFAAEQFRSGSEFEVDDQWMVGVRVNIPLFAGKKVVKNQVKKREAKSQQIKLEQTRQQYRQQLNNTGLRTFPVRSTGSKT